MLERLRSAFGASVTQQTPSAHGGQEALEAARQQVMEKQHSSAASTATAIQSELLTVAELNRRVDVVLNQAIEQGDYATVSALALYAETTKLVGHPDGARLTFEDPETLGRVVLWLRHSYADILSEPTMRLHTAPSTPALVQASFTRECADAARLQTGKCVEVPRYHSKMEAGEHKMEVHFRGAGAAALLEGINKFIKVRGLEFRERTGAEVGERQAVRAWIAEALQHMPQAKTELPAVTGLATKQSKAQGLLPNELSQALYHRMVHLRGLHTRAEDPEMAAEAMRRESRHATRARDCITLAALALLAQEFPSIPLGPIVSNTTGAEPAIQPAPQKAVKQVAHQAGAPVQPQPSKYMTADQVAEFIQYDVRTVRERLTRTVFLEGIHYVKPGRKILYIREAIEKWLHREEGFC